jgi:acetyl-CoA acetyltransferase
MILSFFYFTAELAPVSLEIKKKPVSFDTDEHPRVQTTMEMLAKVLQLHKRYDSNVSLTNF